MHPVIKKTIDQINDCYVRMSESLEHYERELKAAVKQDVQTIKDVQTEIIKIQSNIRQAVNEYELSMAHKTSANKEFSSPIWCEHANECPVVCPCPPDCDCQRPGAMCNPKVKEEEKPKTGETDSCRCALCDRVASTNCDVCRVYLCWNCYSEAVEGENIPLKHASSDDIEEEARKLAELYWGSPHVYPGWWKNQSEKFKDQFRNLAVYVIRERSVK